MEIGKLTVSVRTRSGKGAARGLRAQGLVPGVCYGANANGRVDPLAITVNVKELKAALDPVRKQNTVIDLTVTDGSSTRQLSALLKEYQVHPLRREVTHVDLLAIDPSKEVFAAVPLEFTGKHAGTLNGGQIRMVLRSIEVRCKPADIPVKLNVDVTPLDIGDVFHVSDIALPPGVAAVTGRDQAVVLCAAPEEDKTPVAAAVTADAAAPADAKAAPAAGGKAPAAAGKAAPAAAGKAAPAAAGKAAPAKK